MKTLKLFDYYMEFPFEDETLKKRIDSLWLGRNLGQVVNSDIKKIIHKESIINEYEAFKKEKFFFKINEEYLTFFFELGIKDVNSFLFPNPLHDETFLEFELFLVTSNIGEDIYVINKEELKKLTDRFDYDSLIEYIKTMEVNTEYILEKTIDMNNYAFEEYREGYLPNFNELAQSKLEELKES